MTLSIPLFTGDRQDRRLSAAKQDSGAARLDRAARLRDLERDHARALADWQRLEERIALYSEAVNAHARETREASLTAYAAGGTADFPELVRSQLARARYGTHISQPSEDDAKAWAKLVYLAGDHVMNTIRLGFLGVALAAAALTGFLAARFTGSGSPGTSGAADMAGEGEVLYWVAPMDPNFRRDAPGKSPMGMELVPVYADGDKGGASAEPALRIEPAIVNNIGVRTAAVRRQDMPRIIRTVGNVMADQEKRSDIHVRSEGWIETLTVETVGEQVGKGDLLFRIYSPELVTAQGEYLQILMLDRPTLAEAAEERLAAMGMGKDQDRRVAPTAESATPCRRPCAAVGRGHGDRRSRRHVRSARNHGHAGWPTCPPYG